MYTLYRDGEGFGVRRDVPFQDAEMPEETPRGPRRVKAASVNYAQWKRFMDKDETPGDRVDGVLLDSWRRCKRMKVDPAPRSCWDFTPMSQLEPFSSVLRELSVDIESDVYAAIKGRNLLMTVADAKGRLARTCGDLNTLRRADRLNFGPGANWAETSVGTNAISLALATGQPSQVFGEEHFCRSHHSWSCTAAPIFDPHGNIWGCFDISGPTESDHSRSFDLVIAAAREIEKRLYHLQLVEMEGKFCSILSAAFNSVLTGILSVDVQGRITSANSAAETLLRCPGGSLRGRPAEAFFDFNSLLAQQKHDSPRAEPVILRCHANPDLVVRAAPVFALNGLWSDTVVTIVEPQRVRPSAATGRAPLLEASFQKESHPGFEDILHRSTVMREAIAKAANAARTPSVVLLTGESGTGKELFARGIHKAGPRSNGPFVAVNCGAIAEELVQSEFFGYRGGAFTGADRKGRIGKFEQADNGVLFLDEIAEMPLNMQVNLLRALEDRAVVPVGGDKARPVNVKIVAATNRDLAARVAEGSFRADLYYRINVVGIRIPPLRERLEDIPLLVQKHARRLCREFGVEHRGVDPEVLEALMRHSWPGNVRELLNCIEYAVNAMRDGVIHMEDLPPDLLVGLRRETPETPGLPGASQGGEAFSLEGVEAETIREALQHHDGNISRTAKALGIGRNTLYAKLRKFRIRH